MVLSATFLLQNICIKMFKKKKNRDTGFSFVGSMFRNMVLIRKIIVTHLLFKETSNEHNRGDKVSSMQIAYILQIPRAASTHFNLLSDMPD